MRGEIEFRGSYALLKVYLGAGERVKVEPGAMVYSEGARLMLKHRQVVFGKH